MLKYYLGYSTTIETYCVTQAFPNLEKLTVNHPKFVTMDNNQIWPENLTKLTIYNTNTEVLPLINGSRIQSLTIQNWKNLRHSAYIGTVRPKYLFSFDTFYSFLAGLVWAEIGCTLGVSPSLVSRYCEGHMFWST